VAVAQVVGKRDMVVAIGLVVVVVQVDIELLQDLQLPPTQH